MQELAGLSAKCKCRVFCSNITDNVRAVTQGGKPSLGARSRTSAWNPGQIHTLVLWRSTS
jgi:hypothetical protein